MRAVELFCGAGGLSLGLKEAGIDVVQAFDVWPVAIENYRRNVGDHAQVIDLKDILSVVPKIVRPAPDLICGGPPCQDFSTAGARSEGENASLTLAFAIIVAAIRPKWFLMENVIQAAKSAAWAEARAILVNAGYGISESRLDASRYQVPQSRRRLILCGRLGERDGFLQSAIAAAASAPMSLRQFFGATTPAAMYFPSTSKARRSIWGADEPAPTIRERSIRPLPESYQPHPADAALIENGFVYARPVRAGRGVRSIDEAFPTVTRTAWERPTPRYLSAPHRDDPVSALATAVLTIDQVSRIQGFPPWWEWKASAKRDLMQMIANAVPAPLAAIIGRVVLDRETGASMPQIQGGFTQWLIRRGRSPASARNVKAQLGRARRLLHGRTFSIPALEIAALESVAEFQGLRKPTQSDLRQALRLYVEYLESRQRPRQRAAEANSSVSDDKKMAA